MQDLLNKNSKIVTLRVSVPAQSVKVVIATSQLPILQDVQVFTHSDPTAPVSPAQTGYSIHSGGLPIYPATGSIDELTSTPYASPSDYPINTGEINQVLQGSPYEVAVNFYNNHATEAVYYFMQLRFTSKVDLPVAPVTADKKSSDND
jgi:hypothetical protein